MKKRIVVLLSVVALMVVMLAMSVAPAFAAKDSFNCRVSDKFLSAGPSFTFRGVAPDYNSDGIYCIYVSAKTGDPRVADNHPALKE